MSFKRNSKQSSKRRTPPPSAFNEPTSPPTPPRDHRDSRGSRVSLSTNPMQWLSRSSSQVSTSPTKSSITISEPIFAAEFNTVHARRSGRLGNGATVIAGTPQEALTAPEAEDIYDAYSDPDSELPSPPRSPTIHTAPKSVERARPTRCPPPLPRPALKASNTDSGYFSPPPVPALPQNLPTSPVAPPFEPILLSGPPSTGFDPSKVIVCIETETQTYKTLLSTLTSTASYLATYLTTLVPQQRRGSDAESFTSSSSRGEADSVFHSIFRNHLASSGITPAVATIQIFLDRPSAPYAHILSYLRAPIAPGRPPMLPRAVQLHSSSSRLEALLELRDEAAYLDLHDLHKLCTDEIRTRQAPSSSSHTTRGSVSSMSGSSSIKSSNTYRESLRPVEKERESMYALQEMSVSSPSVAVGRSPSSGTKGVRPPVPQMSRSKSAMDYNHNRAIVPSGHRKEMSTPVATSVRATKPPAGWL